MEKGPLKHLCKYNADFLNAYSCEAELPEEQKNHFDHCPKCKAIFEANLRLKLILKRAVNKAAVPEDLASQIWQTIRSDRKQLTIDRSS
jgi:predicted anti-sigma-YlaC factor YlaD